MKNGAPRLRIAQIVILSLSTTLLAGSLFAQQTNPADNRSMDADKARVIEYWNQERRQQARPRDLVIDPRGLGYLRRQDGSLEPHGHQINAEEPADTPVPQARPPSNDDSTPPTIAGMDPAAGAVIGAVATFSATVTDSESGVRSVSISVVYPDGTTTETFPASQGADDVWSVTLQGFTDGDWSWSVEARDGAKRGGNVSTSDSVAFTVDTGGGSSSGGSGGGSTSDTVTNAEWSASGNVQLAAGRLYFEMPGNSKRRGPWVAYVCSGTVVTEPVTGRSIVLTAAHCVYDDANKSYARNVLFIPDQADTTGTRTDTNCSNDPLGCWVPSFGVVDVNWTTRKFPDNIAWDYAYYVVDDTGAHAGAAAPDALDGAVPTLAVPFYTPYSDDTDPGKHSPDFTHALGYSYSDDPKFMYCAEDMTTEGNVNWWLPSCGLSGGSSGGPWVQPMDLVTGDGPVISVNSWGYTNSPGMAGPKLDVSSAQCVMTMAEGTAFEAVSDNDGDAGVAANCG